MQRLKYQDKYQKMKKTNNIYALYKGDKFLDLGTADDLAKYLNVTKRTILFYNSKVYKERRKKGNNYYIVIKVEDDE